MLKKHFLRVGFQRLQKPPTGISCPGDAGSIDIPPLRGCVPGHHRCQFRGKTRLFPGPVGAVSNRTGFGAETLIEYVFSLYPEPQWKSRNIL